MNSAIKRVSVNELPNLRLPKFHEVDCLESSLDMESFFG